MARVAAVVLAGLLTTGGVAATPDFGALAPAPSRFQLENGLDVVLQRVPHQRWCAVMMAYDVGARDEPEGYGQLAHLVEHLTYQGSRHLAPRQGRELLERAGMRGHNGETSLDSTSYYSVVPTRALPLVLWLESERMAFTLERFDDEQLSRERAVVRNELLLRRGPEQAFQLHLLRAAFGEGHPYAKDPYPYSDLDAIALDDARWFFQQGYRPRNAHLIIVGDIDVARVGEEVRKYFGPILNPRTPFVRPTSARAPLASSRRLRFEHPTFLQRLAVVWPAPAPRAPERAASELFVRIFGGRLSARLVRGRRDLAGLELGFKDLELGSLLVLNAPLTRETKPAEAEAAVFRELEQLPETVLAELLPEVKAAAVLEELLVLQDPLAVARRHATALRFQNRPYEPAKRVAELRGVRVEDLLRARRRFSFAKTVVASLVAPPADEIAPLGGEVIETP